MKGWTMYGKIQELKKQGFKKTRVAQKLSINFRTVDKYWDMNPDDFAYARLTASTRMRRADLYREEILGWILEHPDMMSSQIYDWLVEKYGERIDFAERTLRDYVDVLRKEEDIPRVTEPRQYEAMEDPPMGYQSQVDMGEIWLKTVSGRSIKVYGFAMVMSHSRHKYVCWQTIPFTTDTFVDAHEKAFEFFGGRTKEIVYDQDKVMAVSENHGDIIYTEGFQAYLNEMKFKVYLCRGADPESKGRVEAVIKYAKRNFAEHRVFTDIETFNVDCIKWLERRGNGKEHTITKKIPAEIFALEVEYLIPVKSQRTAVPDDSVPYQIRKDNTVLFEGNRYRVPKGTYRIGRKARLGIDGQSMVISDAKTGDIIARHTMPHDKGNLVPVHRLSRDLNRNQSEVYEHVLSYFSDNDSARKFLNVIKASKPRYFKDQLGLILKVCENIKLSNYRYKAMDYCINYHLYSAVEFKAAAEYFCEIEKVPATEETTPIFEIKYPTVKPAVRDISEYGKLMEVK